MNEIIKNNITLSENGVISLMMPDGKLMALDKFEGLTRPEKRRILKGMKSDILKESISFSDFINRLSEIWKSNPAKYSSTSLGVSN